MTSDRHYMPEISSVRDQWKLLVFPDHDASDRAGGLLRTPPRLPRPDSRGRLLLQEDCLRVRGQS